MKKGDIVLVPFPFADLIGAKIRPALVLINQTTSLNVVVSFITSKVNFSSASDIPLIPSVNNGLKKASLLKLDKLTSLDKTLIQGLLGELSKEELSEVNHKLVQLFQLQNTK